MLDRIAKFFCSLRLTVVLLCAGLLLVFVGTLAQVDEGLYAAQTRYFRSWYIWEPTIHHTTFPILLPGGYLIGCLLLLNLIAAHIKRFQFTTKKIGIQMIHFGVILLLLGQLLTDVFSQESSMRLSEGSSSNYSEDFRDDELVLIDTSNPASDHVVSIPESIVAQKGEITDASLPCTLHILNYWPNCVVEDMPPPMAVPVPADHGAFTRRCILALPDTAPDSESTRTAALVEFMDGKNSLGTYLVPSRAEEQQIVKINGKSWVMMMTFAPMLGGNILMMQRPGDQESMLTFAEDDLKKLGDIKNDSLGATIHVKGYWPKCVIYNQPGADSIKPSVTAGSFNNVFVTPQPLVTDTDHRNLPAAIVQLSNNQGALGTWLLWTAEGGHEIVDIGGKSYELGFQFKRYYRPFSIGLLKFANDKYKGTDIPKNFSSRIRLVNPSTKENREVLIRMNEPLRYQGTTYYQAGFDQRRSGVTILEVVTNPGWLTPYLACVLVGLGLVVQFGQHLVGFATKRRPA